MKKPVKLFKKLDVEELEKMATEPAQKDPFLAELAKIARKNNKIQPTLYQQYSAKRGLRNADGTGVLVGLTEIGDVHGYIVDEGEKIPVEGIISPVSIFPPGTVHIPGNFFSSDERLLMRKIYSPFLLIFHTIAVADILNFIPFAPTL